MYYSELSGNKAGNAYGGGAINSNGDSNTNRNAIVNIYNSIIKDNECLKEAGGWYMLFTTATIEDTTIDNNVAKDSLRAGGGMSLLGCDLTMTNTIISNNDAGYGGGLAIRGGNTVTIRQSTFTGNDGGDNKGDHIYTESSPTVLLVNTVIPTVANSIVASTGTTWTACAGSPCSVAPFLSLIHI